jgi:ribosome-associated heat shock protein Hsp15
VRLNGERPKPAKEVGLGDTVEVRIGEMRWTVVVQGVAEKRGSAKVAGTLYEETEESVAERGRVAAERNASPRLEGPRPTKLDRRRMDAMRRRLG